MKRILITGGCGFTPHNSFPQNGLQPVIAGVSYAGRAENLSVIWFGGLF